MSRKIVQKVQTETGWDPLYSFNPSNVHFATVEATSTTANYNLTIDSLETPYDNAMGIILFIPNVTNIANATITLNGVAAANIKFQDGTNITDGIFIANTPILVKYYNGEYYMLTSKAQVGLNNVDNTADTSKPVSTAQQTALNGKLNTTAIIPNGANLNSYTTPGLYVNTSTTFTISNRPTSSNGKTFSLIVEKNGNGVQQSISLGSSANYNVRRSLYGGTWGNWIINANVIVNTIDPVANTSIADGTIYIKRSTTPL